MKLFVPLLLSIFFWSALADTAPTPATDYRKTYLKTKNSFFRAIKQRDELKQLKNELETLNKTIKRHTAGQLPTLQELEEQRQVLESKIQLVTQKHQGQFQRISSITPSNEPYNLLNFFSKAPIKSSDSAIESLLSIKNEFDLAASEVKTFLRQLKENHTPEEQSTPAYKAFYNDVLNDQRYLGSYKELIDKQYDHLIEQRAEIEKQYYQYRDRQLFKHLLSLAVIISLVLIAYTMRRAVVRYVPEDERQFSYNRTISTTAAMIGLVFILITYSENILYSFTVFTFVGAAAVIATREFWLNVVAWIYIILSNFIKVGDRVLIPHETKYYFGDIINISPVKLTLYEAYDFSSTKEAVTAGRIIFLPNSYIFSHAVINYTHQSQRSIFDHISLHFSMESDLQKAEAITREILREETAPYLDEAKQQFDALKKRYDVKQRMLEPEIQFTVNATSTAVKMTAWYMTPSQKSTTVKNRLISLLLNRLAAEPKVHFSRKTRTEKESSDESSES